MKLTASDGAATDLFGANDPVHAAARTRLLEAAQAYWKEVSSALMGVLGTVSRGGQAVLNWLVNLVLIPVVTFYLLRDWDRLVEEAQHAREVRDAAVAKWEAGRGA